jgi:flavin reductase (DIM6/NTAB) family NADH-FMN oxidoreductase RutF
MNRPDNSMIEVTQAQAVPAMQLIEQGDPSDDARAFRRCLGQYPTGVTVITARRGDKLVGMAVNSFAAVSLDPPLVLWSLRRESRSVDDFLEVEHFAVNILAADQVQVSQWFGAAHPERFELARWQSSPHGVPLLEGVIGHLECRRVMVHEGGDHLILIGHVERYARFEGEPLLFTQGQYAVAQNHPCLTAGSTAAVTTPVSNVSEPSFLRVLSLTNQRMSALFEEHRLALGVNPASSRVLNRLHEDACDLDALERSTYLGRLAIEDALAELMTQQLVLKAGSLFMLTPSGREKSEMVTKRAMDFSAEKLTGIAESDIAAARRVLRALLQK